MDLDLRKLRYFVAVAEHGHFGRAAAALYIAQPVLSRQVLALEKELGATLLTRTTRSVELTPAGEQLLQDARGLFVIVDNTVRRVLETDRGVERLVVGFAPGLHVGEAVRAFTAEHPAVEVDLVPVKWWEKAAPLYDGRVDVAYLRRPFDESALRVVAVGTEEKVACLPATHPLARRHQITMSDLDGQTILDAHSRRTSSVEEKFELIAAGHGIALVPAGVAASYTRPDLVSLVVTDLAPVDTCIAVARGRREHRIRAFVTTAIDVLHTHEERLSVVE
ncbi:transcriptional regulator [Williamsia sp. Leaf354]|uniref:LysR family transcriptional regulator n=1 Tax=Williamsia sp. Leaf354 TaxID=1736349 RepID=UPI0006F2F3ED|nr:LysR substrate-binding domain-containing protein [Williamsia sp. Leaf354]KQR99918.1 transcriptional regulator [Williamsia sp. Leaf354]